MRLVEGIIGSGTLTGGAHITRGLPGQDYAKTGATKTSMWGVVCDGCSGGGTDVGLGACAVGRVAFDYLAKPHALNALISTPDAVDYELLAGLRQWEPLLGIENLLATVVMAKVEGSLLAVRMRGDGGFALFHSDGSMTWRWALYTDNTPGYLAYRLRPGLTALDFNDNHARFRVKEYRVLLGKEPELLCISQPEPLWHFDTVRDDICGFALFTDGIETLRQRAGADVLMELVRTYGQRSPLNVALGACAIGWQDKGEYPADDLAIVLAHW
jgi:hypothetical protein